MFEVQKGKILGNTVYAQEDINISVHEGGHILTVVTRYCAIYLISVIHNTHISPLLSHRPPHSCISMVFCKKLSKYNIVSAPIRNRLELNQKERRRIYLRNRL